MTNYRNALPQSPRAPFISDGGMETTLIYHDGQELPLFASFHLLRNDAGTAVLERYYTTYATLARRHQVGLILDTPTWRANRDWALQLGYDRGKLAQTNRQAVALMEKIRRGFATRDAPMVISGAIGPRGDGYVADHRMSSGEAREYHREQIETFAATPCDMISAFTLNYVDEAVGLVQAARDARMPVVVSFTVETDGRLPSGETLRSAIERTDDATAGYPSYYMINCAHPDHFQRELEHGGDWLQRIGGIRANASRKSHAELDASTELDAGDPQELAQSYVTLRSLLPNLSVIGGCCGTDHRHVEAMCETLLGQPVEA